MTPLARSITIARNDFAILRQDPMAPIVLMAMPLVVMAFTKPAYSPALQSDGYAFATGAEQVVPGMAVMFAFFIVTFAGLAFFREHVWVTWDRLRSLPVSQTEIMVGKLVPQFALVVGQQLILLTAGGMLFGLTVRGSMVGLVLLVLAFALFLMGFIVATVASCRTFQQLLAVSNLGAIGFAGIGGALTPLSTLPSWASAISPATPVYWAMKGFKHILLDGEGLTSVLPSVGVLTGAGVVLFAIGARRFRFDEHKGGTLR
jgi:ABC-2 type transport system permease protein